MNHPTLLLKTNVSSPAKPTAELNPTAGFAARERPPSRRTRRIVGVEIQPHLIRMVLLEQTGRGHCVFKNVLTEPYPPFASLDSAELTGALRNGLTRLAGNAKNLEIWAGIPLDRVRVHHLSLPPIKETHLSQGVYWALQREESFSNLDTVFDFETERGFGENGKVELAVSAFLLPAEDRDTVKRLFREAGFSLSGLTLPLWALRNFDRSGWRPSAGGTRIFSHVGAQSSRIGIWTGDRSILTRAIPIGLTQVAAEVASALHPAPTHADALRMVLGLGRAEWADPSYDPADVFSAAQPALVRIARQIDRTVEYHRTKFPDRDPVQSVILAGAIADSPRCCDYLRDEISVPLELLDPFATHATPPEFSTPAEPISYATAFGLALSAEGRTPDFLRTFNDRQRERRHHRIASRIFAGFCAVALILGGFYAQQHREIARLQSQRAQAEVRLQSAGPRIDPTEIDARLTGLRSDLTGLARTLDQFQAVAILAELSKITPASIHLHEVSASLGQSGAKRWLRLSGSVSATTSSPEADLSLFLRRLEASPLFHDVTLRETRSQGSALGVPLGFVLELSLVPSRAPESS